MKQQVVVIHGGDAFATYEEYISYLKDFELDFESLKKTTRSWKKNLSSDLGDNFEVISPRMPNGYNAKYLEWKIWFEKLIPYLEPGIIFVGHSLGGIFLAKYLSEENFPKQIKGCFLVAPPFNEDENGTRKIVEFTLPASLKKFEEQGGSITIYHSKDDPIVPFGELLKYKKEIPSARTVEFHNQEHFFGEHFPELVTDITSLSGVAK